LADSFLRAFRSSVAGNIDIEIDDGDPARDREFCCWEWTVRRVFGLITAHCGVRGLTLIIPNRLRMPCWMFGSTGT